MVQNGIEHAVMQIIAKTCDLMKCGLRLKIKNSVWNKDEQNTLFTHIAPF
jgi:6-phosphogluconate dehydrogenase